MSGARDLLKVPQGAGSVEHSHRTHILVYISEGATPSCLYNLQSCSLSRRLEEKEPILIFCLRATSFPLSHSVLQGELGNQGIFLGFSTEVGWLPWKESAVFPVGPPPAPSPVPLGGKAYQG